jgi:hypothetical protein
MLLQSKQLPNKPRKSSQSDILRQTQKRMDVHLLPEHSAKRRYVRLPKIKALLWWSELHYVSIWASLLQLRVQDVPEMFWGDQIRRSSSWMFNNSGKYCYSSTYFGKDGGWYLFVIFHQLYSYFFYINWYRSSIKWWLKLNALIHTIYQLNAWS